MVPRPQGEQKDQRPDMSRPQYYRTYPVSEDDEIVISGMAGKLPMSDNVAEYANNLYNKLDMLVETNPQWLHVHPMVPKRMGKISDVQKFDATFFGVHHTQVFSMDPQCRLVLEQSYMAIMDAGINPNNIRGSRIGVYVASCFSESEKGVLNDPVSQGAFGIIGCSRAMYANRISYALGLTGPSFYIDTACSSSLYALDAAYAALRSGEIDGAVVGGANLILHPNASIHFARLGVLSSTSNCRPFDQSANGYVRSEGIGAIYLQRRNDARRIYATLVHSKTNCDGYKPEGITFPSSRMQEKLLREFYDDVKLPFDDIGYMEAHSTGTMVGDPEECTAIDNAICKKRTEPLLVGSVKSNIGHTEPTSGICSIIKVMIAFQTNKIPPNINFTTPRKEIAGLMEGRMKVIEKITDLKKPYVGINSFGFGGANAHILVKQYDKLKKKLDESQHTIPRVVLWSGRTHEAVEAAFTKVENQPLDPEYIALMHSAQAGGVPGMVFRGFNILQGNGTQKPLSIKRDIQHYDGMKRPVVWVFSGMGSQWSGMGAQLMNIPLFRESIQRCHNTLKPTGLDLIKILTSDDKKMYDNITHSFVGIAAVQIALVDVLRAFGLEPDFIIGHSTGELGCAYADGCFTLEQMILAAYYRGKVSLENRTIKGSMAAIGLSYNAIRPMLPEAIEVACHNSSDSCTISGPAEDVAKFVNELQAQNIFAREVPCSNIAFHTRHIAHLGGEFLKYLKQIVPTPKKRSPKWLSSSVPYKQWTQPKSLLSSAEYHTNNLLSSVLFEEASALLPKNALMIEIAPHSLLQSILRSAIPNGVYVGLTQRNNKENHTFFLTALGKLYLNGINIPVDILYPKVEWPVSRGTETISDVIKLDHRLDWPVQSFEKMKSKKSGEKMIGIDMKAEQYLSGHNIDGKILLPATYYVESVCNAFLTMHYGTSIVDRPVEIENLRFVRATTLAVDSKIELALLIHFATGNFEIVEGESLVVSGTIREITDATSPAEVNVKPFDTQYGEEFNLTSKDIYKELKLRGYYYSGEFKGIESIRGDGQVARLKWTSNWVTFMDCMLQTHIIKNDSRDLCLPTKISKIRIFGSHHMQQVANKNYVDVYSDSIEDRLVGGGVELIGLEASSVQRRKPPGLPVLERYQFIPNATFVSLKQVDIGRLFIQLVLENEAMSKLRLVEVIPKPEGKPTIECFLNAIEDLPLITGEYSILSPNTYEDLPADVVVGDGKLEKCQDSNFIIDQSGGEVLKLANNLSNTAYVVVVLKAGKSVSVSTQFKVIATSTCSDDGTKFMLLRKKPNQRTNELKFLQISSNDTDFKWLKQAQEILSSSDLLLVAEKDKHNGVLGLTNCLRKEYTKTEARCLVIDDPKAPPFDPRNPLYANQLALGMAINIYRNGQWGTFRHLQLALNPPEAPHSGHVYGNITQRGDLSSVRWLQGPVNPKSSKIKIVYSTLNFRDIMLASGRISLDYDSGRMEKECVLGMEYSGIDMKTGKRIMGMLSKAGIASYSESISNLTMEVPKSWSLRDAATVPVVYLTVYYSFFFRSDIRKGKSILIHAGTGGVGLSAIRTALAYGLEVFTTVSTAEKRNYLLKNFPRLKASHIGNSRDTSFEAMIRRETKGKGVDFVLNSLSEEKLIASIRCLAINGVFLEIGKFDMLNDNPIGLAHFMKEITFVPILLDLVAYLNDQEKIASICAFLEKDIASGIVQPLPSTVFPAREISQAFRFLASGKHIGKVLIQVRDSEDSKATLPIQVLPVTYFSPDLVYIVAGGLGGFGLELVDWMVLRGARKIVLSSSRGISNGYQSYRIRVWKSYGCEIRISTANIGLKHGCEALIRGAMTLAPIGGIFNLAVVLKDAIFENQTVELYKESMTPKAIATKYLDELSRQLCPSLEHFVIFSSVSCGRGNAGQTNYGMANSIMERIIEDRVAAGLPGKAIEWGAVGEVGLVAVMAEDKVDLEIGGTLQQRISSCLRELDVLLSCPDPLTASMVVAEKRLGGGTENLIETVMNIMGIRDTKSVSFGSTLSEVGMDSLMAVDIKQTLERDFDLFLSPQELRTLTLQKLQEYSQEYEKTDDKVIKVDIEGAQQTIVMLQNLGDETNIDKVLIPINQGKKGSPPIFVIPGIEGTSGQVWMDLGKNLNAPAYVVQLHKTAHMENFDEIAKFVFEHVKTLLNPNESYRIVGYSYGAIIAVKTAHILEQEGHTGKVLIVDGSPEVMALIFKAYVQSVGKDNVEPIVLSNIVSMVLPDEDTDACRQNFLNAAMVEQTNLVLQKYTRRQKTFSESYFSTQCAAVLQRCRLGIELDTSSFKRITAPICLVKPKNPMVSNISPDYDLSLITVNEVDIRTIDGNHATVLENPELPQLINQILLS